ncbi:MAG: hypothetical protein KDD40_08470 [Bdellovibrionales bacterium]|nr:hypothetical protein [Bdellovibrionales bacterium]
MNLHVFAEPTKKWPKVEKELQDIYNKKVKWTTGQNGALVLFTSEHCPFDLDWQLRMIEVSQWASNNNFNVFIINPYDENLYEQNQLQNMKNTAAKFGKNIIYIADTSSYLTKAFRTLRTPSAFVFNASKERVYYGMIDDQPDSNKKPNHKYLLEALTLLSKGQVISNHFKQTLGCEIPKENK